MIQPLNHLKCGRKLTHFSERITPRLRPWNCGVRGNQLKKGRGILSLLGQDWAMARFRDMKTLNLTIAPSFLRNGWCEFSALLFNQRPHS